jgi:hypothetical protein
MGGKKRYNSPEKWPGYGGAAMTWWEGLSLEEKQTYKKHYEKVREWNTGRRNPYPNMYDTTIVRISQLSQKQIYRIWVFKDNKME